jgi:hypothetical protein
VTQLTAANDAATPEPGVDGLTSVVLPQTPFVSVAYMGKESWLPTAMQFPELVQLTPVKEPLPPGTSTGVPHTPPVSAA